MLFPSCLNLWCVYRRVVEERPGWQRQEEEESEAASLVQQQSNQQCRRCEQRQSFRRGTASATHRTAHRLDQKKPINRNICGVVTPAALLAGRVNARGSEIVSFSLFRTRDHQVLDQTSQPQEAPRRHIARVSAAARGCLVANKFRSPQRAHVKLVFGCEKKKLDKIRRHT